MIFRLGHGRSLKLLANGARFAGSAELLRRIERFLMEPARRRMGADTDAVLATVRSNLRWLKIH